MISEFNPEFYWEKNINKVAHAINLPHEDYPIRVDATRNCIDYLINREINKRSIITLADCLYIHAKIMSLSGELNDGTIIYPLPNEQLGKFRNHTVMIGKSFIPMDWRTIPDAINNIFPVDMTKRLININTIEQDIDAIEHKLKAWYIEFETIHPFSDGNGRVGGIIVAALSHPVMNMFLTPELFTQ